MVSRSGAREAEEDTGCSRARQRCEAFRRGRDVSASVGLVPREHSTGGRQRLYGISKRGDRYLRTLLVQGAQSVVNAAQHKDDRLSRWINATLQRRGKQRTIVALANKLARIGWAVLRHNSAYQVEYRAG